MPNVFLISDTHFGHKNIIEYSNRPFSDVIEMNEHIAEKWNKTVAAEDTVFHLGDVVFGNKLGDKIISSLNGNKILIRGNHDKQAEKRYMRMGFSAVLSGGSMEYGGQKYILSHIPVWSDGGFVNIHGHMHELLMDSNYTV